MRCISSSRDFLPTSIAEVLDWNWYSYESTNAGHTSTWKSSWTTIGSTTDIRILLVLTQSVWPSSAVSSQRRTDGSKTDRRITQPVWPSSAVPSERTADGLTMDRRILLVSTQSVWPSSTNPSHWTADGLTTDRRILLVLTQSVWPSSTVPSQRTADGLTMDRRILLVLTQSGRRAPFRASGLRTGGRRTDEFCSF
jgi:hypothetical protein